MRKARKKMTDAGVLYTLRVDGKSYKKVGRIAKKVKLSRAAIINLSLTKALSDKTFVLALGE
jgi:hypothetical protein